MSDNCRNRSWKYDIYLAQPSGKQIVTGEHSSFDKCTYTQCTPQQDASQADIDTLYFDASETKQSLLNNEADNPYW